MTRRYFVYVIELAPNGPTDDVYVGSSALWPQERFEKHLSGGLGRSRASRHVRRRGIALMPQLYEGLNPFPSREAAERAERRLRGRLERQGYRVYGSCLPSEDEDCWI